ncbi:MAG: hypothetical protein J6I31_00975 [Prevotella sp.]|nr:hypothetical protein [Prevotella sp.]
MKKSYITPQLEIVAFQTAPTMQTISTGQGEITDPGQIQAIRWAGEFEDIDEWEEWMDEYDEV